MNSDPRWRRRIGAVFAGLVAIFVLSMGIDTIMHVSKVFPEPGVRMADSLFVLAMGYRIPIAILGCYLTAKLAPNRPMAHALWLGGVGVVISSLGVLLMGDLGPLWYSVGLVLTSMPCAWIGGKFFELSQARQAT
ncbi:MAG: hypothetical protein K8S54_06330 [Spirochaetia bacterium]|nr:hypothetical protein [Spirochaetia bacterium]